MTARLTRTAAAFVALAALGRARTTAAAAPAGEAPAAPAGEAPAGEAPAAPAGEAPAAPAGEAPAAPAGEAPATPAGEAPVAPRAQAPAAPGAAPASAAPATAARRLRVEIACPAAIAREALVAALVVELSATPWILSDAPAPDATLAIGAAPCTPTAALELTLDSGGGATPLGRVALPAAARARGLALLIAETLADVPAPPPRRPAVAAAPSDVNDAVLARDLGPRAEPTPGRADELELSALHRFYFAHPDKSATGLRITGARELAEHRLRVAVDVGGDQMATPHGFEVFAAHLGGQLGIRRGLSPHVALELGVRGELTGGYARVAAGREIAVPWLAGVGAGVIAAVAYDLSESASLRLELDLGAAVSADDLEVRWSLPDIMPPSSTVEVFTSSAALSLGIAVR